MNARQEVYYLIVPHRNCTPLNVHSAQKSPIPNQRKWISLAVYPILRNRIPYFLQPTCAISFLVFQARSTFRWMTRMCQSIHRWRAGEWLRLPEEIGLGNLIFTMRVKDSVAPSENAPLRDIPIRDTLGAPPLVRLSSRNFRRASSFPSCWQKSCRASAYF